MDQRRVWIAVGLSLLLLLGWEEMVARRWRTPVPPPSAEAPVPAPVAPAEPEQARPAAPSGPAAADARAEGLRAPPGDAPIVSVETDLLVAKFTSAGARLVSLELKGFRRDVDANSPRLNLVEAGADVLPLTLQLGAQESDAGVRYEFDRDRLLLTGADEGEIVFTGTSPDGKALEKRMRFRGDGYLFDVRATAKEPAVGLIVTPIASESAAGGQYPGQEQAVALAGGRLKQTPLESLAGGVEPLDAVSWSGFAAQYFAALAMPYEGVGRAVMGTVDGQPIVRVDSTPSAPGKFAFQVFFGPKDQKVLGPLGHDLGRAIDFGYFWFIAVPLLRLLELLHRITANYGIDIIVLTVLVKVVTIPLTQTSFRSMKAMQQLQPEMTRLRERYKDDQVELQKQVMELYRRNKVNPFSGCLPMLLQMPIFFGLYNALVSAIDLRHAPFMFWINDLSAPDRLMIFGIPIPVLTLLMGASMLLQQMMTPQQGDPTQQKMMMIMPVIFTFFFMNMPSGLVLYWLVNNVLTIGQQYWMLRKS